MNKHKWITAVAVAALSTSLAVAAPGGKHHGRKGGHDRAVMSQRLAEKLNLSEAQKQQIRDLQQSFREQNKPLFDTAKQTRAELKAAKQANDTARLEQLKATMKAQREQFKQAREAQVARIREILTPDQRAQWDALKAERANKRNRQ